MVRSRVIKNYLKTKGEIINEMVKSSMSLLKKRKAELSDDASSTIPPSLTSSVQPVLERISMARSKLQENQPVVSKLLEELSDEQLGALKKAFDKKKKVSFTEERLYDGAHIALDDLAMLEEWSTYISHLRGEIIGLWVASFAQEFHQDDNNNGIHYSNELFVKALDENISYRRGIRRASSTNEPPVERPDEGRCCVM